LTGEARSSLELPDALEPERVRRLASRRFALFLDYDGTLTPIVERPEMAVAPEGTAELLERLARRCTVAVVSGRSLDDLRSMVDPAGAWLAGSHGFELRTPAGELVELTEAQPFVEALHAAADELEPVVAALPGAWVERKRFAVAVHFRQLDDARVPELDEAVAAVAEHGGLRRTGGKRIFELRPDVDWDKGTAVWSLFERAGLATTEVTPVFIGDDLTDEDAFTALDDGGVGIVVTDEDRPTRATLRLADPAAVATLLGDLATSLEDC